VGIIAKIEKPEAVDHFEEILDRVDGIMIARGDLGIEMPMQQVPIVQKQIIRKCLAAAKPVITATQMLESMIENPRPTRAEASDVANAVLDGSDAVMLSGETAMGDHPVRVVETMDRIVRETEASPEYARHLEQHVPDADETQTDALARSARSLALDISADAIVAASESGYTALKAAKFRPSVPVVASTPDDDVRRQLVLSRGVTPVTTPYVSEGAGAVISKAVQSAVETNALDSGDRVIALSGMMTELDDTNSSNMLKIHRAP
jgi:pyruvate kinase